MIDDSREKLINMMIFFLKETNFCAKTKLFKLLSFSDFLHFKKEGKSISGLEYYAWDMGAVPKQLDAEFKNPPKDLSEYFYIPKKEGKNIFKIKGKKRFYNGCFTPNEVSILKQMQKTWLRCHILKINLGILRITMSGNMQKLTIF